MATVATSERETILLVEDEELVRKLLWNVLRLKGYGVLAAENGEEALRLGHAHPGPLGLLLTDVRMEPGMSGPQLARRLRAERPGLRVVYMSGHVGSEDVQREVEERDALFLAKPFTIQGLMGTLSLAAPALRPGA